MHPFPNKVGSGVGGLLLAACLLATSGVRPDRERRA